MDLENETLFNEISQNINEVILESEMAFNDLDNAVLMAEHEIVLTDKDESLLEKSVSEYFRKVIDLLKKFWDKVKSWFRNIISKLKKKINSYERVLENYGDDAQAAGSSELEDIDVKKFEWEKEGLDLKTVLTELDLDWKKAPEDGLSVKEYEDHIWSKIVGGKSLWDKVKGKWNQKVKRSDTLTPDDVERHITNLEGLTKGIESLQSSYEGLKKTVDENIKDAKVAQKEGDEEAQKVAKAQIRNNKNFASAAYKVLGKQVQLLNKYGSYASNLIKRAAKAYRDSQEEQASESTDPSGILDQYMN